MKQFWLIGLLAATFGLATGCDRGQVKISSTPKTNAPPKITAPTTAAPTNVAAADASTPPVPPPPATGTVSTNTTPLMTTPSTDSQVAIIKTTAGEMVVEFWPDVAPKTVANFKKLAGDKFYDGTAFHRIMKGFMIQGGDPYTKDPGKEGLWGSGGPGHTVDAEFNDRSHQRGVLSMARSGDPNSAGSQFFICLGDASFLDRQYTAFGQVIKGDDVLGKIGDTPVVPNASGEPSKPTVRVDVQSIKLVDRDTIK